MGLRPVKLHMIASVALSAGIISAQPRPDAQFDVLSVRRVVDTAQGRGSGPKVLLEQGRIELHSYPLQALVAMAFEIPAYRIVWLGSPSDHEVSYDVRATMPPTTTIALRDSMLQNMLKARLGLHVHHETKRIRSYALTISSGGLKLAKASEPSDPDDTHLGRLWIHPTEFSLQGSMTIQHMIDEFSSRLDRPFVDLTGLQGYYRIQLSVPRESVKPDSSISPSDYTNAMWQALGGWDNARFFKALEKQAGLIVAVRDIDTDMLVVDSFNPTPTSD